MEFFGEPAVGVFDLACVRLAIYAQDFVGITHPLATPRCNSGLPPARPGWPLQCGNKRRAPQCKRIGLPQLIARSARFQGLEPPYLPPPAGGTAGSPFKPVLRVAVHIAAEEVPAVHARFRVGRRQGSDVAAGAAARILPWQACIPATA